MAEIITGLIALPVLYLIGEFYLRLCLRLWRSLRYAAAGQAGAAEDEPIPGSGRFGSASSRVTTEERPSPARRRSGQTFFLKRR
jgi:hypothetical protein